MLRVCAYPLQTEALSAGLFFWFALSVLFFSNLLSRALHPVAQLVWLLFASGFILLLVSVLFEYGLDLLADSAAGKPRPPVLRGSWIGGVQRGLASIYLGERRFLRQVIVVAVFAGPLGKLLDLGFYLPAVCIGFYLWLTLPASMAANVLHGRLPGMLNPVVLFACIRHCGWHYVGALLLLTAALTLGALCYLMPPQYFVLLTPLCLYASFLCCHVTGLGIDQQYEVLVARADFKAYRNELQAVHGSLETTNEQLTAAHELLRAGDIDGAQQQVVKLLNRHDWANFEQVHAYVAAWFDSRPAVFVCGLYLTRIEAEQKPMRSLALAQWCLACDAHFTLSNPGSVLALGAAAVTPAQHRCVLQLAENHLNQHAASPQRAKLQALMLAIAAQQLKDEALFQRLSAGFASANA